MSDGDAMEADALHRLETALDRIAQRTRAATPPVDAAAIATRLDRLIAQLRDALSDEEAGPVPGSAATGNGDGDARIEA